MKVKKNNWGLNLSNRECTSFNKHTSIYINFGDTFEMDASEQ